jgi:hypothetical protein
MQLWTKETLLQSVCRESDKDSLWITLYLNCLRTKLASVHFVSFAKIVYIVIPHHPESHVEKTKFIKKTMFASAKQSKFQPFGSPIWLASGSTVF